MLLPLPSEDLKLADDNVDTARTSSCHVYSIAVVAILVDSKKTSTQRSDSMVKFGPLFVHNDVAHLYVIEEPAAFPSFGE